MATGEEIDRIAVVASAVTWPFACISTILFFMRIFAQSRHTTQNSYWEDIMLTLSWGFAIVQASVFQVALNAAKDLDATNLPVTVPKAAFWAIMSNNWSFLSIELPKVCIAILLVRLFRPALWLRIVIWGLCVTINVLAVVGFIITWVMCNPVAAQWNPYKYPTAKCWPRSIQITYACVLCGISSFINIAFSVYPAIVVWKLQMARWKKISTIGLMSLGLVAFAFSVVKLYFMTFLLDGPQPLDLIYLCAQLGIWNRIENDFVLMVGLLPFVPAFFQACTNRNKTHTSSNGSHFKGDHYFSINSKKQRKDGEDELEVELASLARLKGAASSSLSVDRSNEGKLAKPASFS
ncbi:uncharacterized protein PGRI_013190 [Penicillium griseofulvum]|uniref:Rhodopsin domain-containing protein n=1 Tax=Penicillium patulum TaxID=5078 RepID=A0A135LES3_PENPA|nr:uncharacterized protein PGRI_013190 [Penicillium griseofulvum]KXG47449.1 hypothetical protein PGRI_013190 [Penicillium griseofulvum]